MKEATGELNMTVVTVVAIAAVAAFFYAFVWPNIQERIKSSTYCSGAINCDCSAGKSTCECQYIKDAETGEVGKVQCPNPDSQ